MKFPIIRTDKSFATIFIRLMAGSIFVSEGLQKFILPSIIGAGRFEKIGLPAPEFLASFVGFLKYFAGY